MFLLSFFSFDDRPLLIHPNLSIFVLQQIKERRGGSEEILEGKGEEGISDKDKNVNDLTITADHTKPRYRELDLGSQHPNSLPAS